MNDIMGVASAVAAFAIDVCAYDPSESYTSHDHFVTSIATELDADGLRIRKGLESLIADEDSYSTGSETFYISLSHIANGDAERRQIIIELAENLIAMIDHINSIQIAIRVENKKHN